MLLVPRQLQRVGMTGDVPYYGGRMTPAQAYAASHPVRPQTPPPTPEDPRDGPAQVDQRESAGQALRHLLATGVITQTEFDTLHARVSP